jgi:Protein of unknown function (DUF1592)/Protein of unknown function (DUF1588)/Protein of unknown function (DUF1587)/Protein of unknown function (DUF1595)/Ca-dependent carbohydrate-binding module xylan-binding/Protein of unknown function (DUF1585)
MNRLHVPMLMGLLAGSCTQVVNVDVPGTQNAPRTPDTPLTPETPRTPDEPAVCDPGQKRVQRLNKREYNHTVQDLLGVTASPADAFPADDSAKGFDNQAEVLAMSPLLVEQLNDAAETLANAVMRGGQVASFVVEAETLDGEVGGPNGGNYNLFTNGSLATDFTLPADGTYTVVVRADQQAAGPDAAQMEIFVDGNTLESVAVAGAADYTATLTATAGSHRVGVRFLNDFFDQDTGADRNLLIDTIGINGPVGASNALRDRFVVCDASVVGAEACARTTWEAFLPRAYRRPVAVEEVDAMAAMVNTAIAAGDSFDDAMATGLETVLMSPHFLYRVELDPRDNPTAVHRVGVHDLASRLSYFLWSTMPDDELMAAANDGSLATPSVLRAQTERMLASPRMQEGFALVLSSQWLKTNELDLAQPNAERFPEVTPDVRAAMKQETQLLINDLIASDAPIQTLVNADFTYLNPTLANLYGLSVDGLADDDGDGFVRANTAGTGRSGILSHAGILTMTSFPLRTSPVKRGKWVLEQLLCIPPGDVPAGVPVLNEDETAGTVRQRLEQHRADPNCASCHVLMDPIGFGLESFDPIGRSRTTDTGGDIIDDSAVFLGVPFVGVGGLASTLTDSEYLPSCVADRLTSYAVGRGLTYAEGDVCTIADVVRRANATGFSFTDLATSMVESDVFQMRKGEE